MKKILLSLFLILASFNSFASSIVANSTQPTTETSSPIFKETFWSTDGTFEGTLLYVDPTLTYGPYGLVSNLPAYFTTLEIGTLTGSPNIGATDTSGDVGAGYVGEIQRAAVSQASAITLTSGEWIDIASINIGAGDWHINGQVCFTGGAITGTVAQIAITSTSGNSATGVVLGDNSLQSGALPTATADQCLTIADLRVSSSSSSTRYLKAFLTFTVGTAKAYGRESSFRVR